MNHLPPTARRFARRGFKMILARDGVDCLIRWQDRTPEPLRALVAPISRTQTLAPGGFQQEHNGSAEWLREDDDGRPLPVPAEGQLLECAFPSGPQVYRIDEVIDNPAAPTFQVGLAEN